ncbi:Gfo/Idh/MocA family oxidoreductase [Aquamicrobium sp. LC103]|uniref:Gfo/Idh/MocA family protein n=1 Tax=Aquamicrobium sp. LC103 TaxID=1120658 RepID=UPI00063E7244|nr:Gfo/Idh/MocA family oxidoreductase [Aquamicrobium sp. LC103]TKT78332.1 Gfo/Idh/MocA family oxidoreductase [Aquamicrobium sp. LC103]
MATADTVLICGFGAFGEPHAKAWRRLDPDIELMVADPSQAALRRASQLGIAEDRLAADPTALMDRADIVDVVAPPAFHLPLALSALEAGKPVMIEKPAVKTVSEAHQLIDAAGLLPVQIGLVLRAHPLVVEARRLLSAGEIGELLALDGDFSGWKRMRADSSLAENDGVHFLDLMRHFAGSPIVEVEARSWSMLDSEVADDIVIELGFADGAKGRLRLGVLVAGEAEDAFVPGAVTTKRLTLIGRAGNIAIDFNRNRLVLSKVAYERSAGGHGVDPRSLSSRTALASTPEVLLSASFGIFRNAVRDGAPVMCDASQGALELAATLAAIDTSLARQFRETTRIDGARP